ncbi:hypothetical protein H6781_00360 [Candidatus Nomurabacteria bacterium]|nr:hypothetical protein [Candidatus Kaiserbacteria bacterium]MCB9810034.1 hypothetical protein [Candidatus Nomurabacteria bacterium]
MKDESKNKKGGVLKSLAIIGFVGIIIIISWLSIQLVNVMPNAFSSLASLAEGLNQQSFKEESADEVKSLLVTSNTTLVNTGESVKLSWETVPTQGSYTFSYSCTEGVSIDILDVNNGLRNIACNTNYNVGNLDSINISVESEKKRFENIEYSISFLATNDTTPRAAGSASFTVVNSAIQDVLTNNDETEEESSTEEEAEVSEPVTEVSEPTTPTYNQEFVYTIPTSDPNGRTDLSAKFLATGKIVGNSFFPEALVQDENGALQFEVKNYGTKTSAKWTYTLSLPGGGTYSSTEQSPLKPNERAVITIGFPTNDNSSHTFVGKVTESTDKNTLNNQFSQAVSIKK